MRLRTFTAPDMPTAIKMVRDAMGEDAIILSSEPQKGKKGITVTAAHDGGAEPIFPTRPPTSTSAETIRHELHQVMRFHNVPEVLVSKILNRADPRELASLEALHQMGAKRDARNFIRLGLEKALSHYFKFQPLDFENTPQRLMIVGTPGIGKTLTVAKLAAQLSLSKQPVAVFTADTKRAGGVEQLQAFTNILEIPLQVAPSASDLARRLKATPKDHHAILDTAGCNPYDGAELKELNQIYAATGLEPILAQPAGGDALEAMDIAEAFLTLPVKRLLITRADTTRRFGGILAAAAAHKLTFSHMSDSSSIIEFLSPLDAAALAQLLLRYQLQST